MSVWVKKKLGDIVEINALSAGKNFQYEIIQYMDIASVGTGKIENVLTLSFENAPSRARRIVSGGDTILSTVRPNKRSFAYIKNPAANLLVSTGFAVLTPKNIDSRFLYYLISRQEFTEYLTKNAKGATYPAVDEKIIARAEVDIPDLSTQKKIASILSAYDDLIENNEKRIKILEEMAQRLYTEWFVKFKFPGYEKVKMIDSGVDFGMIPAGWGVRRLGDFAALNMGQSPESKYYNTEGLGFPFHQGVADFGNFMPETRVYATDGNKKADAGDVLFSVRAPVGEINIASEKMIIGRGVSAMKHKAGYPWFLYLLLKSRFTEKDLIGNGAIYKSVNKAELENLNFIYPQESLVADYEKIARGLFEEVFALVKLNKTTVKIRDGTLPDLLSPSSNIYA